VKWVGVGGGGDTFIDAERSLLNRPVVKYTVNV
jgi:hypothetical protein